MRHLKQITSAALALAALGAHAQASSPSPFEPRASLAPQRSQDRGVPVTIKELNISDAIAEFQSFKDKLGTFRTEISEGRAMAQETAQILDDLRASASPENNFNEKPILGAITGYVDGVLGKQVELVDFLESQRYRISYYANQMAASVRPEDLAILFGTTRLLYTSPSPRDQRGSRMPSSA